MVLGGVIGDEGVDDEGEMDWGVIGVGMTDLFSSSSIGSIFSLSKLSLELS